MRRREFMALCASFAGPPLAVNAQQAALPVVGYLGASTPRTDATFLAAFRSGLGEIGFNEGRNLTIDYRFAKRIFSHDAQLRIYTRHPRLLDASHRLAQWHVRNLAGARCPPRRLRPRDPQSNAGS
jgi:hypothetical protein